MVRWGRTLAGRAGGGARLHQQSGGDGSALPPGSPIEGYRSVLYRSGDLVKLEGGTGALRFRGRADNQVKLLGYRVELEEIDHARHGACGGLRGHLRSC